MSNIDYKNDYKFLLGNSFEHACNNFRNILRFDESKPVNFLEVGCREGCCSLWLLDNIISKNEKSKLYCIDVNKYDTFFENIKIGNHENSVVFMHGTSFYNLCKLVVDRIRFDFIYVDACHFPRYKLEDIIVAFNLLKVGGIMAIDDYLQKIDGKFISKDVIDCFLSTYSNLFCYLLLGYQVWIRRER